MTIRFLTPRDWGPEFCKSPAQASHAPVAKRAVAVVHHLHPTFGWASHPPVVAPCSSVLSQRSCFACWGRMLRDLNKAGKQVLPSLEEKM